MTKKCAWCSGDDFGDGTIMVTHTICGACYSKQRAMGRVQLVIKTANMVTEFSAINRAAAASLLRRLRREPLFLGHEVIAI